uniref:hypothetical protein n=1 Tax=Leucobacter celer TaxID=668625 RepID=UPI000A69024E
SGLDEVASEQHGDTVGDALYGAEIVRDEQSAEPVLLLQFAHEREDCLLSTSKKKNGQVIWNSVMICTR